MEDKVFKHFNPMKLRDKYTASKTNNYSSFWMNDDWDSINPALYFAAPKPPRPTIQVAEHKDGNKVKNGIRFKTKWR